VFYKNSGLSLAQIGVLASVPTIMYVLANPLWAAIADVFHIHKQMLPLTMLLTLPSIWLISQTHSFIPLVGLVLGFAFCLSPIISLADYSVLNLLGDKRYEYGNVRVWGAVGFGISAWLTGAMVQKWGTGMLFVNFFIFMTCGVAVASQLPAPRMVRTESYWKGLRKLVTDARWYGFLLGLFMVGMSFSVINTYFILFVKSLGGGEALFGLSVAMASLSELPVFLFSSYMLRKWPAVRLMMLSVIVMAIRCFLISFMVDPRMALLVQLMHGLSFSLMWTAGVSYTGEIAPPGLGASAQALFSATQFGLASGAGALLGSQIYAAWGPTILFQAASLSALVGLVFLLRVDRKRSKQKLQ
jgi:PPP family 3-phenylpropionic acid transporter